MAEPMLADELDAVIDQIIAEGDHYAPVLAAIELGLIEAGTDISPEDAEALLDEHER